MSSSSEFVLIKIGGSSITDKNTPYKVRRNVIKRLAMEIAKSKAPNLLIAHGSGSFGHASALKYGGVKGYKTKVGISKVFYDAGRINEIMVEALINESVPAVSVRPRSYLLAKSGKIDSSFFEVIELLLKQGLVPVICGDVILDKDWKTTIFSGEKTLNLLGKFLLKKKYKVKHIIQVGETEGFLDEKGITVPEINNKNWKEIQKRIYKTNKMDVTGGIKHKVEEALEMSKIGIRTVLISDKENRLYNAIIGKSVKGTYI
jgi:isopentenyl phosphate kinase